MNTRLFKEFLTSGDTLRVYQGNRLRFASNREGLLPLLEYIEGSAPHPGQAVIFDRITGNAAALLAVKAACREVYSPLGSQLAVKTLQSYGIKYHLSEVVAYIQDASRKDMCPLEKLSIGKKPEEFYEAIRSLNGGALRTK